MGITADGQAFYLIGLLFGFLSSVFALVVSGYTLRGYLIARNRTSLVFSISFALIGAGLLAKMIFDSIYRPTLFATLKYLELQKILSLEGVLLLLSIVLIASGYAILIALFFKVASKRVMGLIIILLGLLAVNTPKLYITAHILPVILLFFVLLHVSDNFFRKKTTNSFLVLSSFTLLFVSEVFFLLIPQSLLFYFVGNATRLLAYLHLLANMFLVLKHDVKKG